jgi:hypothetical protein
VIRILIDGLKNPIENIITKSFTLSTMTSDGYQLDKLAKNMTVNFYC